MGDRDIEMGKRNQSISSNETNSTDTEGTPSTELSGYPQKSNFQQKVNSKNLSSMLRVVNTIVSQKKVLNAIGVKVTSNNQNEFKSSNCDAGHFHTEKNYKILQELGYAIRLGSIQDVKKLVIDNFSILCEIKLKMDIDLKSEIQRKRKVEKSTLWMSPFHLTIINVTSILVPLEYQLLM